MKLYSATGSCSLATHIALREAGIPFELLKVNFSDKKASSGEDFMAVNPKGYVPVLRLDDGSVLTENVAVLQFVADQNPSVGLAPKQGAFERYRLVEWLAFINSEVHKQFSPFFNPKTPDAQKENAHAALLNRLGFIDPILKKQDYLMGQQFSVADAYLFTVLRWSRKANIDLTQFPSVAAFFERVRNRPHVIEALNAEKAA